MPGTQTRAPHPSALCPLAEFHPSLHEPRALKSSVIIHGEINPGIWKSAKPPSSVALPAPAPTQVPSPPALIDAGLPGEP